MGEPRVRRANPADTDVLAEYNIRMARETEGLELTPGTVRAGVSAALADEGKGRYFVAEVDDVLVGQLLVTTEWSDWRNGPMWWIQSVYVAPDYRNGGVFRALYEHTVEAARVEGVPAIRLYVEEGNDAAQGVYQRLGMKPAGYVVYDLEPVE
ncbi:GNAT family N-acetyltransferase [Candidatus Poribacteria bacterium]|jgi:GNAT superfamily N-acetyltransferase|nr:GNAT family N-acetyltransferase [Candidatus Poribacteria bacterium]MBT5536797.1 GNAT family N-acetyltransferase [Candidatus Poribacteria bacterium]MBT5710840.1 GNAT family N-acetyltransferase [Candidatus Poribacteria bacterium]MBT7098317.1 GNAT family N-acetyltransferase [Candidatus Poribacteria bacterium]MBT7804115.1 GNAT family N-acetyltransferase [Candidatus Poribacteria bacterium]